MSAFLTLSKWFHTTDVNLLGFFIVDSFDTSIAYSSGESQSAYHGKLDDNIDLPTFMRNGNKRQTKIPA